MANYFFVLLVGLIALAVASTSQKRGLVYVPSADNPNDDNIWIDSGALTWYYNYGDSPSNALRNANWNFVPMLWGASSNDASTDFTDSVRAQLASGANITHVLGFNEPDGEQSTGGSGITPSLAAETWIRKIEPLKAQGIRLGAPAVTGSPRGFDWLASFFEECAGRCTVDFIPVHWYGNFEGLASHIGQTQATYPNVSEIWVTEYALAHSDLAPTQEFFNMSLEYLDRLTNVTRYSYFGSFRSSVANVGANAAMLTQDGQLTDIGAFYLGEPQQAVGRVPQASVAAVTVAGVASLSATCLLTWAFLII